MNMIRCECRRNFKLYSRNIMSSSFASRDDDVSNARSRPVTNFIWFFSLSRHSIFFVGYFLFLLNVGSFFLEMNAKTVMLKYRFLAAKKAIQICILRNNHTWVKCEQQKFMESIQPFILFLLFMGFNILLLDFVEITLFPELDFFPSEIHSKTLVVLQGWWILQEKSIKNAMLNK